jgi:hypothetical protein
MLNETPPEAALAIATLENDLHLLFINVITTLGRASISTQATGPQEQAIKLLKQNNIQLKSTFGAIAVQLTWTPYVAFYGETNAGKSTLIEVLRLYFGETTLDAGISIGVAQISPEKLPTILAPFVITVLRWLMCRALRGRKVLSKAR